jgi:flagellar hook-associated protein 2
MSQVTNLFRQNNPYEKFVQQLVQIESRQKLLLEAQQKEQNERKTALGEVSSNISKFISQIKELENPANRAFQPLKTTSSDETVVRVNSASKIDRASNYNITVHRLATADTSLSQLMTASGNELSAQGDGSVTITVGDKTEIISVETTRDDGEGNMVAKTNQEILESFATAIGEVFGDELQASVFRVDNQNVQFSLRSLETGFENRIQIDGASGALAELTGNMNRLVPAEELDASFTIDGVTFSRATNDIDDAIDGLSFTLVKGGDSAVQMGVQRDVDAARDNINEFIDAYNKMNQSIRNRTFVDGNNNSRGPLQSMRSIRNLTINLRQTALLPLEGAEEGQLARLSDIGIGFRKEGGMYIENQELLDEALAQRPDEVAAFFSGENSPIASMKEQAEAYTKQNGIISSLEAGVDQTISRLDTRIAQQVRYLERYEEQQRAIFNELLLIVERGQQQFESVMNFRMQSGF